MSKNSKSEGEKGEKIAIGELAKWDIDVCIPLSDNLPFDLIIYYGNKLFRTQIKSSKYTVNGTHGSLAFDLRSNNWHKKTFKKYNTEEIDLMILCDYETIYLLETHEWNNKGHFTIRKEKSRNGQNKNCHLAEDYIISEERIKKVLK
jgi:hypothetical protein